MRAVAFNRFGGPEVLGVAHLPVPEPEPGEVRVKVAAATVNPTDLGMRSGRQAAALSSIEPPYVPGMELAGVVDAVGTGSNWQLGDRVLGIALPSQTGRGAQAEQVVVHSESLVRIPSGVTFEDAATLPMNGLTARRALDLLALQPGQTLAVTGAAGAVGGYAVQLGVVAGLRVIGVASPTDEALVRGFGATDFVPRGDDMVAAIRRIVPEGVDAVVDAAVIGGPVLGAIRDGGKVAAVRAFEGELERGITVEQVRVSDYARNQAALQGLADLVSHGRLTLRVAETFDAERAAEAHAKMHDGGIRGRLVIPLLTVSPFKAIELDPVSRQRTGREYVPAGETRQAAIDALLGWLEVSPESAHVDPSRTLVQVNAQLWALIGQSQQPTDESPSQRRAGAKHKRVR